MEFTNEIFFNKKLVQNESVLITYAGKLFKEYSAEVTIVYGFGANWDETQETKMQQKENGFEALITMKNYDTFNFCFKNNYNVWDNNSGFNYISAIEPAKNDVPQDQETSSKSEISEEENKEKEINSDDESESKIEEEFSNLIDSILESVDINEPELNSNVDLEKGYGLQSIDEIKETDFENNDEIFDEFYKGENEINNQNIENENLDSNKSDYKELLNDLQNEKSTTTTSISSQELDTLMDDILNSISEAENIEENNLENSEKEEAEIKSEPSETIENSELPIAQSEFDAFLDKVIDGMFSFFRSTWRGCKKIGVLIKEKAKDLISEDD